MPELPEVEVVRGDLDLAIAGRRVVRVDGDHARVLRRHTAGRPFATRLEGRTVRRVDRHGKYLVVRLDDGGALVVHLGMSGRLLIAPDADGDAPRHTHVVVAFDRGTTLRYVDPRTFGEVFVAAAEPGDALPAELGHLGPDPLDPAWDARTLARGLAARRARLKPLLMDQRFVAGLGNIYSDEVLHRARLRWDRRSDTVSRAAAARLHDAIVTTLREAVALRGSSLADAQYVDAHGRPGGFQACHRVYAREGRPCPACGRPVTRLRVGGRSTFFCRRCQR